MSSVSPPDSFSTMGALQAQSYKKEGEGAPLVSSGLCCSVPIGIALFVITCVAASGAMSGVAFGSCMIGLSVSGALATVLTSLGSDNAAATGLGCSTAVISIIVQSILGGLVIAGFIPPVTMAWISIGLILGGVALGCSAGSSIVSACASADSAVTSAYARGAGGR